MDCLEQARTLYGEYHRQGNTLSQEKRSSILTAISQLIRTSLMQQGGKASFRFIPLSHVIQRTVVANRFHGDQAATAFLTLEKYLVLLAQQPWKREFWVLKTYGGYFCTKVRAHLEGAEEILQLVGFVPDEGVNSSQCLILHEAPDIQVALSVAFDCQVASIECQCIWEYHSKMKCVGLDLVEAMNLLLSGGPNNLLAGLSLPGEVGRSGVLGNMKVSFNPSSVQPDVFPLGQCQGAVRSHTILASGGMGMGVVTGVKSMHQVIGVQPSHQASSGGTTHQVIGVSATHRNAGVGSFPTGGITTSGGKVTESPTSSTAATAATRGAHTTAGAGHSVVHVTGVPAAPPSEAACRKLYTPSQPPAHPPLSAPCLSTQPHFQPPYSSCPVEPHQPLEGPTTLFPHHQTSPLAGEAIGRPSSIISHPPSVAYQLPGSRGSYASSAYGSGSGSASVLSGGSSACTGSSGYCSAASSSCSHDYANLPLKPADSADPSPHPARLLRQSQKPPFPFIEEDETALGAPFPEATHEEHLRESLRNLQVIHPDKTQKRPLSKNISPPSVGHQNSPVKGSLEPAPVAWDDWRWFRGEADKGLLSSCRVDGEGKETKSQPLYDNIPPPTVLRQVNSPPGAALPTMDPAGTNLNTSPPAIAQDTWKATVTPNPVYYPPAVSEGLYCNTSSLVKGPPAYPRASPVLSKKPAPTRREDRVLQTYQSQTPLSPPPIYNNLDRTHQLKVLNVPLDSDGLALEATRQEVAANRGGGRASTLNTTAHYANLADLSGRDGCGSYGVDGMKMAWVCGACTMENGEGERECGACGRGREGPVALFSVAGESRRVCPSCTFENPPGCRSCEVCEALLPQDVHTYV